jgi:hypothetical protein
MLASSKHIRFYILELAARWANLVSNLEPIRVTGATSTIIHPRTDLGCKAATIAENSTKDTEQPLMLFN